MESTGRGEMDASVTLTAHARRGLMTTVTLTAHARRGLMTTVTLTAHVHRGLMLISQIAQVISWSKLWDQALDKEGPRCVNGLKPLVQIIITYPPHATRVCPKCDVNELEVSLLAHILLEHFNARFSESDLPGALLNSDHNQVLPDSTSSVDEDHDVSSSSYNSDDTSDSDPLDYFLNLVCTLCSLF